MEKRKLILLIGAPCAGKSTWAKNYVIKTPRTLRFNRDDLRIMLQGKPMLDSLDEHVVTTMILRGIDEAIDSGRDIIVDQTNVKLKYIYGFTNRYEDNPKIDIKFKIINQPLDLLLERNVTRSRETGIPKIPEHVIKNMYASINELLLNKEFKLLTDKYEVIV